MGFSMQCRVISMVDIVRSACLTISEPSLAKSVRASVFGSVENERIRHLSDAHLSPLSGFYSKTARSGILHQYGRLIKRRVTLAGPSPAGERKFLHFRGSKDRSISIYYGARRRRGNSSFEKINRTPGTASKRSKRIPLHEYEDFKSLIGGVYGSRPKLTIANLFDPLHSKTMTKKQWLVLLGIYVTYLFLGAVVFFFLEKDQESLQRDIDYKLYEKLVAVLRENQLNRSVILDLESYCGRPLSENADLDAITPRLWDFYNSVFFVLTVVSTVGYGNIHPTMPITRAIMMVYAMIGIPMNGILLTSLAQFFSIVFLRAHKKYKRYESRCGLAVDVLKYLVPGILFFIFVPATAFYYFEEWTYDESVYFAFVTLTTIGFGDIVAGQKQFKEFDSDLIMLYKSLILCWIIFGLGYLIMILGFITRAMRSKKMAQFEHKLIEAFTHSKIWHGFSKDIGYLRRVMNELYLDKFKPVFIDDYQHHHRLISHRSKSLPNFAFSIDEENSLDPMNLYRRKRANSDFISSRKKFSRVCSDSDLRRIDRKATFASTTKIQPDELIRHVVGVMGGFRDYEDERRGVDVFSDDEILRSEAWYDFKNASIASINYPPTYEEAIAMRRKRLRTLSECPPSRSGSAVQSSSNFTEWTWSGAGATKIFELVNERHKRSQLAKSKGKKLSSSIASGMKWLNPNRKRVKCHSECMSESKKSVYSSADLTTIESGTAPDNAEGHYMTYTAGAGAQGIGLLHGKESLSKPERSLIDLYMSGDHLFSGESRRETLEKPSLTEFLLALSSLHSRLGNQRVEELRASERSSTGKPTRLADLFPSSESAKSGEKVQEPSNLKRLGRFLLRSYTKSEATGDSVLPQNHLGMRRSVPSRTSDSYLEDNYYTVTGNPSTRIDAGETAESPRGKYSFSLVDPPASNGLMSSISLRMRRGSTPVMTTEGQLGGRSRIGLSSESVHTDPGHIPVARHPFAARWRQGESCSAKPSLSDVKEIVK